MSMQEMTAVITRFQATTDALAALGARLAIGEGDTVPPEILAALDEVLAAAGVTGLDGLEPQQRAMMAGLIRTMFAQSADLIGCPTRGAGWFYTDPVLLEGVGRASMMMPGLLRGSGELTGVSSLLDIGTGVGLLAISATRVWPECTVTGIDVWEPSLELARRNVAAEGLEHRIEIRRQDILDLDDAGRYDCVWLPSFFFGPEVLAAALPKIIAATRPGGHVVAAHYEPPPDPLPRTTMRLRTIRDGGSVLDSGGAAELLRGAGCLDVHPLTRTWPIPFGFVTGRKA
ncbi:MAG TPA: class I SAM-dependent methyltransferase [Streptosporangiaceae bacterium]|nr:class I SAM-dependent methyltransferase [Streptosporangiaceae bacterium]